MHHLYINNCQNHSEWMQRSLNRKSVDIVQFIKNYDISSIKKTNKKCRPTNERMQIIHELKNNEIIQWLIIQQEESMIAR